MGNKNSGRRPQPTPLKVLRGTLRSNLVNKREPVPPPADASFDTPPDELHQDPVAIAEWVRVVPMLRAIGLVSGSERSALISMCQQWARYIEAHGHVRTVGMLIDGDKGPSVNPAIAIADKALTQCQKLWIELGLTPSGRSRLHSLTGSEQKQSKWANLL